MTVSIGWQFIFEVNKFEEKMIQFQLLSFEKKIGKGTHFFFQIKISFLMDGHTHEV